MQKIDLETASRLIDFSGGDHALETLGDLQLKGVVALQNMLANPDIGVGYLADEVGMGKTYIALGVVALMRSLKPSLRVLYICPSANVQKKWCDRELPAFIDKNFKGINFNIRTPQGTPGTPRAFCSNLDELIAAATTGYFGDIFVRMSTFSMSMTDDEGDLEGRLKSLQEQLPSNLLGTRRLVKQDIKRAYAKALNYLLPTFDLVVIDEAHNFKHDFTSSSRNLALSRILGFNQMDKESYIPRVQRALLLSATPFDVNPDQLFNQLNLVSKGHLLPEGESRKDKGLLKKALEKFMVRRLNTLTIQEEKLTRNMYRREWRKGEKAEVHLPSDEHKLMTALIQKQIGDMLNRQSSSPAFQLGLLASFESYAQTARTADRPMFDGVDDATSITRMANEAPDRQVIDIIRTGYVQEQKFGLTLPHPKMDQVSRDVAEQVFGGARKQLIFVRRVKSVNELKQKLDDEYNGWLERHLLGSLSDQSDQRQLIVAVLESFRLVRQVRDDDISGGDVKVVAGSEIEHLPPKTDTIFNWFFRGEKPAELDEALKTYSKWQLPESLKRSLTAKNNANIYCFEWNWAEWAALVLTNSSVDELLVRLGETAILAELANLGGFPEDDYLSAFLTVQVAFLQALSRSEFGRIGLIDIANYLKPVIREGKIQINDFGQVRKLLSTKTFFSLLSEYELVDRVFSSPGLIVNVLQCGEKIPFELLHKIELQRQLIAQSFRTGHPFVDLYISRLMIGDADVNDERRQQWMQCLCGLISDQLQFPAFSSAIELTRLNDNLDLIIKNNLPSFCDKGPAELRVWLNQELPSSAPVIGANGDTKASRSIQARKFRMPGYPLALVSTDVFQEGEDLHTFCDSVIHYGLSASPISIEQKTGRVDRVAALAHRRLQKLELSDNVMEDDFIQVRFPFVRQSIEALQVRVLARRMNEFMGSLHEIGGNASAMDAFVEYSREIADRNEIPDQLTEFLESPYVPVLTSKPNLRLQRRLAKREQEHSESLKHVHALLERFAGTPIDRKGRLRISGNPNAPVFVVEVGSMRAHGELLLKVRHEGRLQLLPLRQFSLGEVIQCQAALYDTTCARTYGLWEKDGFALYQDAEMLVGSEDMTCINDIVGLFNRFQTTSSIKREKGKFMIKQNLDQLSRILYERFQWNGGLSQKSRGSSTELIFDFNGEVNRRHVVHVSQMGDYCLMEAKIAGKEVVETLSVDRLVNLTWRRNREIDLIDCSINQKGNLVARVFHPLSSMGKRELVCSAYVLAVEADRLEYLIKLPDEY